MGFAGPWPGSATCSKQFLSGSSAPGPCTQLSQCPGLPLLRVTRWALFTNIDLSSPAMAALRHLAWRGLRLLPSPMDGHCLLHSVCSSWQSQLSHFRTIDLESIKSNIFIESLANSENHTSFLSSHLSLSRGLRSYLIDRHYKSRFGDLVPLAIANALCIKLDILNENDNQLEYVPILPRGNAIASLR